MLKYFLVLYHLDTLKTWWKSDHAVWGALVFQTLHEEKVIEKLKSHIHTGHFHNATTNMRATGVPLIVKLMNQQQDTDDFVRQLPALIHDSIVDNLRPLIVGVATTIDETWGSRLSGNNNITRLDLQNMLSSQVDHLTGLVVGLSEKFQEHTNSLQSSSASRQLLLDHASTLMLRENHHRDNCDQLFFTHANFEMPICDTAKLFRFWHFGKCLPKPMGPFKLLHEEFSHELTNKNKICLSKAAIVMNALETIHNSPTPGVSITPENSERIFAESMRVLIERIYPSKIPNNWQAYAFTTICKKISETNPNKRVRAPKRKIDT